MCAGAVLEPHFFAEAPRGPQGHRKAPKRRPTAPQESPRAPQRSPRASQGGPRGSQRSLRAPQGSAKAPQREPNGCKEGPSNSKYIAKLPINRPSGRYVNLSYRDTLAQQLGRRPAKPMGSSRVGSTPTGVVFCRCRFVCLQGLHVCLAPMPNIAFLYQEKAMLLCLQHASQTPASHSQRHAGDANGTWRSGQGRMDFHLSRLTVNVQVIFLVPSCRLTCRRGRSESHCMSPPSSVGRAQCP